MEPESELEHVHAASTGSEEEDESDDDDDESDDDDDHGSEEPVPARREVSTIEEVVDGGYGWGSAAPVWDGAMPLGHPVKANRAWMQCQAPGDQWYDQIHVDVWFTDVDTAQRFGFRHGS